MSNTSVVIPRSVYNDLTRWADAAYPHEGCGLLIGRFAAGGKKEVVRFAKLSNRLLSGEKIPVSNLPAERNTGKTEFVMDPDQFNQEMLKAAQEDLDVVGVIHTHPDHPPRPSQIDSSQPFLAQWSNIIVSVEKGKTKEMKSWFREDDKDPFTEETLEVLQES
jgi:proteasome lid subunit RPN8/RPN11